MTDDEKAKRLAEFRRKEQRFLTKKTRDATLREASLSEKQQAMDDAKRAEAAGLRPMTNVDGSPTTKRTMWENSEGIQICPACMEPVTFSNTMTGQRQSPICGKCYLRRKAERRKRQGKD